MLKTIFIPALFKPILKDVIEKIPTGETKKNWLGSEKQITEKVTSHQIVGWSDSELMVKNYLMTSIKKLKNGLQKTSKSFRLHQ